MNVVYDVAVITSFVPGTRFGCFIVDGVKYTVMDSKSYDQLRAVNEMESQEEVLGWLNCFRLWSGLKPHSKMLYSVDTEGFSHEFVDRVSFIMENIWSALPPRILEDDLWIFVNAADGKTVIESVDPISFTWHAVERDYIAVSRGSQTLYDLATKLNAGAIFAPCDFGAEVFLSLGHLPGMHVVSSYNYSLPQQFARTTCDALAAIDRSQCSPDNFIVFRLSCMDAVLAVACDLCDYSVSHTIHASRCLGFSINHSFRSFSTEHPFFRTMNGASVAIVPFDNDAGAEIGVLTHESSVEIVEAVLDGRVSVVESRIARAVELTGEKEVITFRLESRQFVPCWTEEAITVVANIIEEAGQEDDGGRLFANSALFGDKHCGVVPIIDPQQFLVECCIREIAVGIGLDFAVVSLMGDIFSLVTRHFATTFDTSDSLVCEVCGCADDDKFSIPTEKVTENQMVVWFKRHNNRCTREPLRLTCECRLNKRNHTFVQAHLFGKIRYVCHCGRRVCPIGSPDCRSCHSKMFREYGSCGGCYNCRKVDEHDCYETVPVRGDDDMIILSVHCDCTAMRQSARRDLNMKARKAYLQYRALRKSFTDGSPVWTVSLKDEMFKNRGT